MPVEGRRGTIFARGPAYGLRWQRNLALSYGQVALVEMRQGIGDDALKAFRQGRYIIAQLMRRSPKNVTLPKDRKTLLGLIAK
jgi:hypothetical protein